MPSAASKKHCFAHDLVTLDGKCEPAANAAAVLEAYGFPKEASESEIVARLFKMYQELTEKE